MQEIHPKLFTHGVIMPPEGWALYNLRQAAPDLLNSFNDLVPDEYALGSNRERRFGQFHVSFEKNQWNFRRLPHRPFIQPAYPGRQSVRYFEKIKADFTPQLRDIFHSVQIDQSQIFHVEVNQYRVRAAPGIKGRSTPEGRHKDGRDIVGIAVFARNNIEGGVLSLYEDDNSAPFQTIKVQPNQIIVLEDARMLHEATDITAITEGPAFRDYAAFNIQLWDNRRYGEAYEGAILSSGEKIDHTRVEPFDKFGL